MSYKKLMAVYRTRLDSIKRNLVLAAEQNDRDGVHDLRVDIKRMRAFFDLIEALQNQFHGKSQCKPFRRITRNTGVLRDAQVQQEVITAVNSELKLDLRDYELYLHEREMEGLATFRHFTEAEDSRAALKTPESAIRSALKEVSLVAAETKAHGRFYNLRNELIILTSEPSFRPEILHDIRKLAKMTHYTIEIIRDGLSMLGGLDGFIEAVKVMHRALGKWHDDDISLAYLNDFLHTKGIDPELEPYASLAGFLQSRREASFAEIAPTFSSFNEAALKI